MCVDRSDEREDGVVDDGVPEVGVEEGRSLSQAGQLPVHVQVCLLGAGSLGLLAVILRPINK